MSTMTMTTNHGPIVFEMYEDDAPKTVGNFRKLSEDGFYDGLTFHRIIRDFMIQGGCPEGTGTGGPGYTFEDEFNEHKVIRGALAMANAGPNTNGSQFFIVTTEAAPWLDGKHTVFGRVTSGMEVVDALEGLATDSRDRPAGAGDDRQGRVRRLMATAERVAEIEVANPATGQVVGSVPVLSPEQVRDLVARARAAQPAWEALGFEGRAKVLRRAQKWVVDNTEQIVETIMSETGKTREDAQLAEVGYAAGAFGFWAKHAGRYLADERVRSASPFVAGRKLVVRYAPLGVVGIIGPWNYPLTNSFGDCIPAMAAGNAVVLKPSEVTPLTSLLMAGAMRECGLPDGIYQVATGRGETGAALIDEVDMVMFTGSTATGKKVMERAAQTLTPVSLELGGKDPMIVLADADVERAANAATYYSMQNGGQTCISVERAYVEAPVYDEFVARVARKVGELRQGPPGPAGSVDVGAMTFAPQLEIVRRHVDGAREAGATVLTGGRGTDGDGGGRFFQPTVLTGRRPLDGVHDRGDVRADAADHARRRRRGGGQARQRLAVRPRRVRVDEGRRARRADRPPGRGRRGLRQRRPDQLLRDGAADGRLEGVGARLAPRRRRHPQVRPPAGAAGHPLRARSATSTCSRTASARPRCSGGS